MTWVFFAEPLVLAWIVIESVGVEIVGIDLARFGIFLACGFAHAHFTREAEERRRGAHGDRAHIDLTPIWFASAAMVLPIPLVILLIGAVRYQRWLIARKPIYKWMHTNLAIALSALSTHLVATSTPLQSQLTGTAPGPSTAAEAAIATGSMLAAITAYFVAQVVMVGAVRSLAYRFPADGEKPEPHTTLLVYSLGGRRDNLEMVCALIGAVAGALFLAFSAPLLALLVPIAIWANRIEQHVQQLTFEIAQGNDEALCTLTQLRRREGLETAVEGILDHGHRHGSTTAVLLFDLDHFGDINRKYLHLGGDQFLAAFAYILRKRIHKRSGRRATDARPGDQVRRWGGEEFLAVLPETSYGEALRLAEQIRAEVANFNVTITKAAGGAPIVLDKGEMTVSIGVAIAPLHGVTWHELLERADQALYAAKDAGRNRVRAFGMPASTSA